LGSDGRVGDDGGVGDEERVGDDGDDGGVGDVILWVVSTESGGTTTGQNNKFISFV
jgi:hypothetical protein